MNSDSVRSGILRFAGIALAWLGGRYHLSSDTTALIMSDVASGAAVVAFIWGLVDHWGKKKVPVGSTALMLPEAERQPIGTTINLKPLTDKVKVVG